jgi:Fic-DOC domain mobile mystery protein B
MELDLSYIQGQSPIEEDEKEGLLIKTISTRGELDEFEQLNIEKAIEWTMKRKFDINTILTADFVKELHKRMFEDVWSWVGKFRTSNKNIGVDKFMIGIELKNLFDDCRDWLQKNVFSEDEIAIRFGHRIVKIHIFPNGNGRHSRLISDIFISHGFGKPYFSWGRINLTIKGEARDKYLKALRDADGNNYDALIKFARE